MQIANSKVNSTPDFLVNTQHREPAINRLEIRRPAKLSKRHNEAA